MTEKDRPRAQWILLDEVDKLHEARQRELDVLLARCARFFAGPILEIGSGDGFQHRALVARFGRVVATDVDVSRFPCGAPIVRCAAEVLPFRDGVFATVYSSNVLEHVPDVDRALLEMRRVLAPGGHMVHLVPTRFWQFVMLFTRFPHMVARRAYRAFMRRFGPPWSDAAWERWWYASYDIRWGTILADVPVHGVSSTHLEEWYAFAAEAWLRRFRRAGLALVKTVEFDAFTPYGFISGGGRLREALGRLGLASVRGYVLRAAPSSA